IYSNNSLGSSRIIYHQFSHSKCKISTHSMPNHISRSITSSLPLVPITMNGFASLHSSRLCLLLDYSPKQNNLQFSFFNFQEYLGTSSFSVIIVGDNKSVRFNWYVTVRNHGYARLPFLQLCHSLIFQPFQYQFNE
ncbi:hypothetical protein AABB24_018568, partial [Solanum stoloniferum]